MTESHKITAVLEDYLEAILNTSKDGIGARSRDIVDALGVHKSTVTAALKSLGQMGLIHYAPYEAVTLTAKGRKVAESVARRHEALLRFFTDVLNVDPETAEKAACGMEHAMPREILEKMTEFAENVREFRKTPEHAKLAAKKRRKKKEND